MSFDGKYDYFKFMESNSLNSMEKQTEINKFIIIRCRYLNITKQKMQKDLMNELVRW